MTSLCTLPKEILSSILLKLPPDVVKNTIPFVNKQFHGQVMKEDFWKEYCLTRYYVSSFSLTKPSNLSWQQQSFELGTSPTWAECNSALRIINKSYTLSYSTPPSPSTSSTTSALFVGVASKPLVAGLFIGRYFKLQVDSLPAGEDVLQLVVGLAQYDILLNPTLENIYGYTNTGGKNGKSYGAGDRIGVLLSPEYMTVSFLKNGELQSTPYVHLNRNTPLYPVVGIMKGGVQVSIPLPPLKAAPLMPLR